MQGESDAVFYWGGCISSGFVSMDVSDRSDDVAVGVMEEEHQ